MNSFTHMRGKITCGNNICYSNDVAHMVFHFFFSVSLIFVNRPTVINKQHDLTLQFVKKRYFYFINFSVWHMNRDRMFWKRFGTEPWSRTNPPFSTHTISLSHTHAHAHTPVTCSFSVNMHICGYNRLKHSLKNNHKNNHSQYCRRKAEEKQRSRWRPCLIEQREGNIRSLGLLWVCFPFSWERIGVVQGANLEHDCTCTCLCMGGLRG